MLNIDVEINKQKELARKIDEFESLKNKNENRLKQNGLVIASGDSGISIGSNVEIPTSSQSSKSKSLDTTSPKDADISEYNSSLIENNRTINLDERLKLYSCHRVNFSSKTASAKPKGKVGLRHCHIGMYIRPGTSDKKYIIYCKDTNETHTVKSKIDQDFIFKEMTQKITKSHLNKFLKESLEEAGCKAGKMGHNPTYAIFLDKIYDVSVQYNQCNRETRFGISSISIEREKSSNMNTTLPDYEIKGQNGEKAFQKLILDEPLLKDRIAFLNHNRENGAGSDFQTTKGLKIDVKTSKVNGTLQLSRRDLNDSELFVLYHETDKKEYVLQGYLIKTDEIVKEYESFPTSYTYDRDTRKKVLIDDKKDVPKKHIQTSFVYDNLVNFLKDK